MQIPGLNSLSALVLPLILNHTTFAAIPNGQLTQSFPEVIQISIPLHIGGWTLPFDVSSCSATRVGPGTILTAAHCVRHAKKVDIHFSNGKRIARTQHIFVHPLYDQLFDTATVANAAYDLALISFREPTGSNAHPIDFPVISSFSPKPGTKLHLVGFGMTDPKALLFNGAGDKRVGTTSVHALIPVQKETKDYARNRGALITSFGHFHTPREGLFRQNQEPTGEKVGTSQGDSGGAAFSRASSASALLHQSTTPLVLRGVISGSIPDESDAESTTGLLSAHVDLASYASQYFLRETRKNHPAIQFHLETD